MFRTFFIKNPLLFVAIVVGFTVILVFPISRNSSEWTELQMIEKGIINSSVIPEYVLMNMDCYEAIALGVIIEMLFLIIADLIACIAINQIDHPLTAMRSAVKIDLKINSKYKSF